MSAESASPPPVTTTDFHLLADMLPQIVWTSIPESGNDFLNNRWFEYTGLTAAESVGSHHWARVLHPDDQEPTFTRWRHCVGTGEFFEIEYRLRRHDGEYRWFLGQARPVRDSHGRITRWFGTCTDIHELRLARQRLEESEAALRRAYDDLEIKVAFRNLELEREVQQLRETLRVLKHEA